MARPVWPLVTFWKCWSWSTLWTHRTGFRFLIHFLYHQGGDSAYLYLLEDIFNFPFFWHVFAFYFFFLSIIRNPRSVSLLLPQNRDWPWFSDNVIHHVLLISLWVQRISLSFYEILFSHFHAVIYFFNSISKTSLLLINRIMLI